MNYNDSTEAGLAHRPLWHPAQLERFSIFAFYRWHCITQNKKGHYSHLSSSFELEEVAKSWGFTVHAKFNQFIHLRKHNITINKDILLAFSHCSACPFQPPCFKSHAYFILQAMVALELDVDQAKMKGAGQTDSCIDAATTPVLTSKNSGSNKKRGRLSKRRHHWTPCCKYGPLLFLHLKDFDYDYTCFHFIIWLNLYFLGEVSIVFTMTSFNNLGTKTWMKH